MTDNNEKVLIGYTSSIGAFARTIKMSSWENEKFTYTSWDVNILLKAWYYEDCKLNNGPLFVRKHIEDIDEVKKYLNLPLKNTVIKVKTDWEDLSLGRIDISDLLEYGSVDEKLNKYLAWMNQIEQFYHESAGLFLFDSAKGMFVNDILWGEDAIKLEIDSGDKIAAKTICDKYLTIFHNQERWDKPVKEFACENLLDNEIYAQNRDRANWPRVSKKLDFLARVSIFSISIKKDGLCIFSMNDGNYFSGIKIFVTAKYDGTLIDLCFLEGR